jgi:D-3-phosphoglycerate dehydrogenase
MAKILINDGIHPSGMKKLQASGHTVDNIHIPQEELPDRLPQYDAICVRSATKVRTPLIDKCPMLKAIARGGVGLDNIDVDHAMEKGIAVINTPAASSRSVAELAFAHIFSLSRFLYRANRAMPQEGYESFNKLKKSYSKGSELAGKTIGIIGLGRIGEETAKIAYGLEMNVLGVDPFFKEKKIQLKIGNHTLDIPIPLVSMEHMLAQADFVSLHVPFTGHPVLAATEFDKMKNGVIIINAARGGVIDELALLDALNSGKVAAAGLDVFESEPTPNMSILAHPAISLTPHIGASTNEAQEKIGLELADKLIAHFA